MQHDIKSTKVVLEFTPDKHCGKRFLYTYLYIEI